MIINGLRTWEGGARRFEKKKKIYLETSRSPYNTVRDGPVRN